MGRTPKAGGPVNTCKTCHVKVPRNEMFTHYRAEHPALFAERMRKGHRPLGRTTGVIEMQIPGYRVTFTPQR